MIKSLQHKGLRNFLSHAAPFKQGEQCTGYERARLEDAPAKRAGIEGTFFGMGERQLARNICF